MGYDQELVDETVTRITEYIRDDPRPRGFLEEIWPAFISNPKLIVNSYIVRYPTSSSFLYDRAIALLPMAPRKDHGVEVVELGPLDRLSEELIEFVKYGSFYNGHLSVLYEVQDAAVSKLPVLSCFDTTHELTWAEFDALSMVDRQVLQTVIEHRIGRNAMLAFSHDGEPLFTFRKSVGADV